MDEVLLLDKPKGWTSFDVVAKVRGQLRRETGLKRPKVGHAGTLDPMATGLLIVLTGKMTKHQDEYMKQDKVYEAEVTLGAFSDTDDAEGVLTETNVAIPGEKSITEALKSFVGQISQMPPNYSAIKINGQKAYDIARTGNQPSLKTRHVTIYSIENIKISGHKLSFVCRVSSGTYIRSLARDLGKVLGCGGYLSALRRTRIGEYVLDNAKKIE